MALRIGVLLSGGGTTFQNLQEHIEKRAVDGEIVCVISSREDAYGLVRAEKYGIPRFCVSRKQYRENLAEFNREIWRILREYSVELVVLAGFMSLLDVPEDYEGRIMNTHPALIPAFCGKGMYGHHVHEAVLEAGVKISGATIHFVDQEYDHGPIILQDAVPVLDDDTPDTLAARVMEKERELYPRAVQLFAQKRLEIQGRRVRIRKEEVP